MNFYTLASKLNKKISTSSEFYEDLGFPREECILKAKADVKREFRINCKLGIELMLEYKELYKELGPVEYNKYYFITVRPDSNLITFLDFKIMIEKMIKRKCFLLYNYSYEQKGITNETIGDGFHCHLVAQMTQRSKGEVLRDVISSFKNYASPNCIQVDICKNPTDVVDKYLLNYESADGHKVVTQESDALFRKKYSLENLYTNSVSITEVSV